MADVIPLDQRQAALRSLPAASGRACSDFLQVAHGVALYQPADIYQQLERSSKYGSCSSG